MIKRARALLQSSLPLRRDQVLQQARPVAVAGVGHRSSESGFQQQASVAHRWAAFQGAGEVQQVSFRRGPGAVEGGENFKEGVGNIPPELMRVRALRRNEPRRDDFPPDGDGARGYSQAKAAWQTRYTRAQQAYLDAGALDDYIVRVSEESPTAAALIEEAERRGIPITVLPDAEYRARFPGAGIATDDGVFLPASALEPGADPVLEHELTHAVLGPILDLPAWLRAGALPKAFESVGLDPANVGRLLEVTEGWSNGVAAQHVQTHVTEVLIQRERQGLPALTADQMDALYEQAALREAALAARGTIQENGLSPEEALAEWAETPQGQARPPPGATVEEQYENLLALLDELANPAAVEATAFPEREAEHD